MHAPSDALKQWADVVTKIIAPIALLVGAVWTIYTFNQNKEHELDIERLQATGPFLSKRMEIYIEASRLAGIIATSKDRTEVDNAKSHFIALEHGSFAFYDEIGARDSMRIFEACMLDETKCSGSIVKAADKLSSTLGDEVGGYWRPNPPGSLTTTAEGP